MDGPGAVHHVGGQALAVADVFGHDAVEIQRFEAVELLQNLVLLGQGAGEAIAQQRLIEDVEDANAVALRLIGVGGANAPAGGADAPIAPLLFHRQVEQPVVWHGHVGRGSKPQTLNADAIGGQHVQLGQHHLRVDHRARADQTGGVWIENSRGDQVQLEHLVVDHDCVAGIDTTLIAHHHIGGAAQQIGDLALPLVAPLCTDDDNIGQEHGGPQPLLSTT